MAFVNIGGFGNFGAVPQIPTTSAPTGFSFMNLGLPGASFGALKSPDTKAIDEEERKKRIEAARRAYEARASILRDRPGRRGNIIAAATRSLEQGVTGSTILGG